MKGDSRVVDLVDNFRIYCTSIPPLIATESKDLAVQDFSDEDGEEVYDSLEQKMQAFDFSVGMGCEANDIMTCHEIFEKFLNYLTHDGVLHYMWTSFHKYGRQKVRFVSVDNIETGNLGTLLMWNMKFRIGDPVTSIPDPTGKYVGKKLVRYRVEADADSSIYPDIEEFSTSRGVYGIRVESI